MPHLGEELLLLALDHNRGRLPGNGSPIHLGLAAAVLAELDLRGHINVSDGRLTPCADHPDDPILAEALGHLKRNRGTSDVEFWIENLPARMDLAQTLAVQLVRRGDLRMEQRTLLGLFPAEAFHATAPLAASSIRQRLRSCLKGRAREDARTRALAANVQACGLLSAFFSREDWAELGPIAEAAASSSPIASALWRSRQSAEADAAVLLLLSTGD